MYEFPLKVQTYDSLSSQWSSTTFETKEVFAEFVKTKFKIPGEYGLLNTARWKEQVLNYEKTGLYCPYVSNSSQYNKYWRGEKDKVLNGVIIDDFYIPPFYYFYLNYAQIYIKEKRTVGSPAVWDSDYHFFLYIMLCILLGKHAVVVKTRQRGYSYKIMMILFWSYTWFRASVNTIAASDESYVKKSWEYLDEYRTHLNTKTPWKRGPQVPKALEWMERTLTDTGEYHGHQSKLRGATLKQSPTRGVGGYQSFFFYEEAGIAPTLIDTVEYIEPTITAGVETTGTMILSGSVGDLDDCDGLKKIFYSPQTRNFLDVENIWEENPDQRRVGFFVPETWSLHGFIDSQGNSLVGAAKQWILDGRVQAKDGLKGSEYQLKISQKPLTPREAFAWRKDSFFPAHIISRELERLENEKKRYRRVELYEDKEQKVKFKYLEDNEGFECIEKFPLRDGQLKHGCAVIHEPPDENTQWLQYFAGVDPIATDKTTTSESLFTIYIFKNLVETRYKVEGEDDVKTKVTGFKPVAWYVGRREDLNETNQIGEYLLRLYNAKVVVESNVQTFINHMQNKNLTKHMFTKDEIGFLEELRANMNVHKQYGVHMTPQIKSYILQNMKDYVSEVLDYVRKENGEVVKTIYGAERIVDPGLLQEMLNYHDGLNVDRMIAFGLALSIAKHYSVNGVYTRKSDIKDEKKVLAIPKKSFFRSVDHMLQTVTQHRSYFKTRH